MQQPHSAMILRLESGEIAVEPNDDVIHGTPFLSKRAMELAHLQHFERCISVQHESLKFDLVGDGADPPDFIIARDGRSIALELTVLASEARREQVKFFDLMKDRFLKLHSQGKLQNLAGLQIEVSFGDLGGRPFLVSDDEILRMVDGIEAINQKQWVPLRPENMDLPIEQLHPLGVSGEIADGSVIWEVSGVDNERLTGSPFADATGFEITHTHRALITQNYFQREIEALVQKKDREGNEELLITAGGPDVNGRAYPAEGMVPAVMLERWEGLSEAPKHLRRIFLDSWTVSRVFVVYDRD